MEETKGASGDLLQLKQEKYNYNQVINLIDGDKMVTLCLKSEFNVHFLYGCTSNYNELNTTKMNKYHGICKLN